MQLRYIGGLAAVLGLVVLAVVSGTTGESPQPAAATTDSSSSLPGSAEPTSTTAASPARSTTDPTTDTTVPEDPVPTTLPPVDDPDLGSTGTDAVGLGEAIDVGEWRIGVSDASLDATELVLGTVEFNEPPVDGSQYLLVELSGIYQGAGLVQPVFDWKLVSPTATFVPDGLECGIIPNSIYDTMEVENGGEFTANICFEVPSDEVGDDLLLTLGLFDEEGMERFFALQ